MNNLLLNIIILFFLVNASIAFIPYWTRKTENFGVTIPKSFYNREDFKAMRKKYTSVLLLINFLIIVSLLFIALNMEEKVTVLSFIIGTIVYIIASFLVYLPFYYKMKKIKESENWQENRKQTLVIDTKFHEEKLVYSTNWYIIPAFLILATIVYTFLMYDNIPEQVPIHTSFSGKVTYDAKSMGNLLLLPVTKIFMLGIFIAVNYVIKYSKQQVNVENPEMSKQQNILFRRRWSLYMIVTAILITAMFTFMQMTFIYPSFMLYQDLILFSTIGIILFGTIFISITTGQGGSRIKINDQYNDDRLVERDDDQHWKLGQFYVNRNDPSIFVEKRFGVGWTNNWAHPISWIFVLVIITLGISIPLLITLL